MNGLTGGGAAVSEEFGRDARSCRSLSVSTLTSPFEDEEVVECDELLVFLFLSSRPDDGEIEGLSVCAVADGVGGARAAAAVQE